MLTLADHASSCFKDKGLREKLKPIQKIQEGGEESRLPGSRLHSHKQSRSDYGKIISVLGLAQGGTDLNPPLL